MSLKEKIIAESKRLGIDKIGFASAEPFSALEASLREQKRLGHTSGFEHPVIEERLDPEKTFEDPQTIIAIALAYPTKLHAELPTDEKRGAFARASWGVDYHDILRERLNQLIEFIKGEAESEAQRAQWRFKPEVDTGELIDVAVAQRAGLGFIGRNGLLITEEFGSFVYLGEVVTNIKFEVDEPVPFGCGECTRCVKACPTQALLGDGRMNAQRCLSYQTQTKGELPETYRKKIRNVIYGCDICQLVCPYNKGKDFHFHSEMEPIAAEVYPPLKPLLALSNRAFKQQFGHLAGSWRGKKPLQRNALVALANLGDQSAIPEIYRVAQEDVHPVIRATAVWALGQLVKTDFELWLDRLTELTARDPEESVQVELQTAIKKIQKKATRKK
ncbi:tRNA epoxyqueuosine(34) reductase QueG [Enterococcus sp. CSURQ0835]|uniref:tRNA epoxyqueuosine(34) reductase QueG n=1 Tax=Enterococcus sp. CSURQ0835 TaxID=2681394 RepID=UPI00135772F1|nr:tRNA epoxyqueuosine(34) reductase QueG [Enterococcus sp. CSURQ0835]